jgi:hypothetical protein
MKKVTEYFRRGWLNTMMVSLGLAAFVPQAFADMALLMKEETNGYVPSYIMQHLQCRIEETRVTKMTRIGFFVRSESIDIRLEAPEELRQLMREAQRAGITDSGGASVDSPTVRWSASLNSEGDIQLGGIEHGRFYYNLSEAGQALRLVIDNLCGSLPEM